MVLLAVLIATVLAALSTLHLYWAVGGRWAMRSRCLSIMASTRFVRVPQRHCWSQHCSQQPACWFWGASGLGPLLALSRLTHLGAWTIAVAFLLRGLARFLQLYGMFRSVRDTRFAWWDRHVYTPLSILLGITTAIVAVSTA